jgi:hypothetical protein
MKYIKLFEEYSEEHYNRVLDLYNEKGLSGMTPDEIAYMKSGGTSEIPKSIMDFGVLDCPFILCIGEDLWKYYQEDLGINPDGNEDYERDNRRIKFVTFVVKNYEPIKIKSDEDWEWTMNHVRSGSDYYNDEDFEYFQQYDTGLVLWCFDEKSPDGLNSWNDFILNGGLEASWDQWGEDIRSQIDNNTVSGETNYNYTNQIVNIDLRGNKLTPLNLKNEIDSLKSSGKLGDWKNNIDITDDNVYPIYSKDLFKIIYK